MEKQNKRQKEVWLHIKFEEGYDEAIAYSIREQLEKSDGIRIKSMSIEIKDIRDAYSK